MLRPIVYGSFFISCLYFIAYRFSSGLREAVLSGGFWSYLHVFMGLIVIAGIFFIIIAIIRFLFADPKK